MSEATLLLPRFDAAMHHHHFVRGKGRRVTYRRRLPTAQQEITIDLERRPRYRPDAFATAFVTGASRIFALEHAVETVFGKGGGDTRMNGTMHCSLDSLIGKERLAELLGPHRMLIVPTESDLAPVIEDTAPLVATYVVGYLDDYTTMDEVLSRYRANDRGLAQGSAGHAIAACILLASGKLELARKLLEDHLAGPWEREYYQALWRYVDLAYQT